MSEKSRAILEKKERVHIELASVKASEAERLAALRAKVKALAREAANSLANDEQIELEVYAKQLEEADRKHYAGTTWNLIKKVAGKDKKRSIRVRTKEGPVSDEKILSKWRLYFRDLLNAETDNSESPPSTLEQPPHRVETSRFNTSEFTREELDGAIRSLKNNKAPGIDDFVTAELLKGEVTIFGRSCVRCAIRS